MYYSSQSANKHTILLLSPIFFNELDWDRLLCLLRNRWSLIVQVISMLFTNIVGVAQVCNILSYVVRTYKSAGCGASEAVDTSCSEHRGYFTVKPANKIQSTQNSSCLKLPIPLSHELSFKNRVHNKITYSYT